MFTRPGVLLRIEGGCVLMLSLLYYQGLHGNWLLFLLLLLVPDVSILVYRSGVQTGTICYNSVHTLVGPLLLIACTVLGQAFWLLPYWLIWTSHIGLDRMLGYGLKYPTRFNDTHLQRVSILKEKQESLS
jgi:hypothetical protein